MHDYSNFEDNKPGDNILAQISIEARKQLEAERKVSLLEEELEKAKGELKAIAEVRLPELMSAARQSKLTTTDGIEVVVDEKIRGSIPKGQEEKAFKWLSERNYDNLIKREFKIEFGKDEEGWAKKFEADLAKRKKPLKVVVKRAIHPSTLSSFLSELLEKGVAVPLNTFGCYQQRVTKLNVKD